MLNSNLVSGFQVMFDKASTGDIEALNELTNLGTKLVLGVGVTRDFENGILLLKKVSELVAMSQLVIWWLWGKKYLKVLIAL